MNRFRVLLAWIAAAGCRGEMPVEEWSLVDTTQAEARTVDQLPPAPEIPTARRGYVSAVSAGTYLLSGEWRADATICQSPALLELFAGVRGMRTLLVLRSDPGTVDWSGTFPLMLPDSTTLQEPPAASLAVQVFEETEAAGFQAIEGEVQITTADGVVSGSFDSVLRESRSHLLVRYLGSFDRIHVSGGSEKHCDQLGGVVDSSDVDTEETADTLD